MTWTTPLRYKPSHDLAIYEVGTVKPHNSRAKRPIIMLHGVGLCAQAWQGLTHALPADRAIIAIDLPGHGRSAPITNSPARLRDYSDRITEYLQSLPNSVHLIGHSMGASIALDIAARSSETVQSVTALNAIYRRTIQAAKSVQKRAKALKGIDQDALNTDGTIERWFGKDPQGEALKAAQACRQWIYDTDISQYQQAYGIFAHYDGPTDAALSALIQPALFITGADEPNSTPQMSQNMAALTPYGHAQIITGAAHMLPMTHAEQAATYILHHINQADTQTLSTQPQSTQWSSTKPTKKSSQDRKICKWFRSRGRWCRSKAIRAMHRNFGTPAPRMKKSTLVISAYRWHRRVRSGFRM